MVMIRRRSFLEKIALGAGAAFLSPLASALVNEARGQAPRRRLVMIAEGNGMGYGSAFKPPEVKTGYGAAHVEGNSLLELSSFTLPPAFEALAPYRDRLLLVDGLANTQHLMGGHWGGYIGFNCVPNTAGTPTGKSENSGGPGAATFDQYVGGTLGKSAPFRSVDLGMIGTDQMKNPIIKFPFAYARDQPVPVQCSPAQAFARLFAGAGGTTAAGAAADQKTGELLAQKRRFLFDFVRDDIKRLQANLVGRERAKLEEYLGGIATLEARFTALSGAGGGGIACGGSPLKDAPTEEERLEQQFQIGTAALNCGLTQVVTISSAPGPYFSLMLRRFSDISKHGIGHGGGPPGVAGAIHNWHSSLIKSMLDKLGAADDTLVLYSSDNGESHHARHYRWPVALVAGRRIGLRAGRYLRFPSARKGEPRGSGVRALADLYITLSHVLGVPSDKLGEGSAETVRGPLGELV